MRVHLARWGNSAAVRLPKAMTDELGLSPGASFDAVIENGEIRLRPVRRRSEDHLRSMIEEERRLGGEAEPATIDWGEDRGGEIIDDRDPR